MGGEKVMGEEELLRCVNFLRDEITAMRSAQDELRDELREMKAANDKSFTALLNELQKVAVEKVQDAPDLEGLRLRNSISSRPRSLRFERENAVYDERGLGSLRKENSEEVIQRCISIHSAATYVSTDNEDDLENVSFREEDIETTAHHGSSDTSDEDDVDESNLKNVGQESSQTIDASLDEESPSRELPASAGIATGTEGMDQPEGEAPPADDTNAAQICETLDLEESSTSFEALAEEYDEAEKENLEPQQILDNFELFKTSEEVQINEDRSSVAAMDESAADGEVGGAENIADEEVGGAENVADGKVAAAANVADRGIDEKDAYENVDPEQLIPSKEDLEGVDAYGEEKADDTEDANRKGMELETELSAEEGESPGAEHLKGYMSSPMTDDGGEYSASQKVELDNIAALPSTDYYFASESSLSIGSKKNELEMSPSILASEEIESVSSPTIVEIVERNLSTTRDPFKRRQRKLTLVAADEVARVSDSRVVEISNSGENSISNHSDSKRSSWNSSMDSGTMPKFPISPLTSSSGSSTGGSSMNAWKKIMRGANVQSPKMPVPTKKLTKKEDGKSLEWTCRESGERMFSVLLLYFRSEGYTVSEKKNAPKMKCIVAPGTAAEFTMSVSVKSEKKNGAHETCVVAFKSSNLTKRKITDAYLSEFLANMRRDILKQHNVSI